MGFEHGLLWKLKFNETRTSYLLGTIHLNSVIFLNHKQVFSTLFDECTVFAAEVNLDQMNPQDMDAFFRLPENTDWTGKLKPNQWIKLNRVCQERFHLDLENYKHIFPLVVVNQLSLQLIGMSVEKSLDQSLWEFASEKNMKRTGLEDFDTHFSLINQIQIDDQVKMLKDLLKNLDQSKRKYLKMIKDYHAGDLRNIYLASKKMLGKYRKLMLYERNHIMAEKIMEIGMNESGFFTCGAGHLYGETGILRLLKKEGVRLKHVAL